MFDERTFYAQPTQQLGEGRGGVFFVVVGLAAMCATVVAQQKDDDVVTHTSPHKHTQCCGDLLPVLLAPWDVSVSLSEQQLTRAVSVDVTATPSPPPRQQIGLNLQQTHKGHNPQGT